MSLLDKVKSLETKPKHSRTDITDEHVELVKAVLDGVVTLNQATKALGKGGHASLQGVFYGVLRYGYEKGIIKFTS